MHATAVAAMLVCALAATDADAAGKRRKAPAADPAYVAATQAYEQFERKDFLQAAERAREAVRLAPQRRDYWALLAQSLTSAGRLEDAWAALQEGDRATDGDASRLKLARDNWQRANAQAAGAAMYKALAANDLEGALRFGRQATMHAPEHPGYRMAYLHTLVRAGRHADAEQAAGEAIALLPESAVPLALRGYARQQLGKSAEAQADFERALKQKGLSEADARTIHAMASSPQAGAPSIDCGQVERTQTCAIVAAAPPPEPGFESASAAYRALEAREPARALDLARQATAASPGNKDWRLLHLQAAMAAEQWEEARTVANALQASGELPPRALADIAYLNSRLGDNRAALGAFAQADAAGALPANSLLDAGYAAMREGRDAQAVGFFTRAIDAADALELKMEPQMRYDTRRMVSELERRWGVLASLNYRPGGGAVPGFGTTGVPGMRVLQVGAEGYWRPWGYRNGRIVELFLRGFETLHSEGGGATGSDSFEGAAGVRWKPFATQNAVLSVARTFGTQVDGDWLLQAAWSFDKGTDLRMDVDSWATSRGYVEAGRYVERKQTYGLASVMVGRSFRAGGSGNTVLFPHAVLAAEYDSALAERTAVGAGGGVGVRWWFRDDKYHAPRSYVDLTLQYRARIAGDDRAQGFFLGTLLSY